MVREVRREKMVRLKTRAFPIKGEGWRKGKALERPGGGAGEARKKESSETWGGDQLDWLLKNPTGSRVSREKKEAKKKKDSLWKSIEGEFSHQKKEGQIRA